jgi:aspartokinase
MSKIVEKLASNNILIEIISQWMLQRSIVIWIKEEDLRKTINLLHNEFILWGNTI